MITFNYNIVSSYTCNLFCGFYGLKAWLWIRIDFNPCESSIMLNPATDSAPEADPEPFKKYLIETALKM
jgi:hypothetical protein